MEQPMKNWSEEELIGRYKGHAVFPHFASVLRGLFDSVDLSEFYIHTAHANIEIFRDIRSITINPNALIRIIPQTDAAALEIKLIYRSKRLEVHETMTAKKRVPISEAIPELRLTVAEFRRLLQNLGKQARIDFASSD
jgi:hypothetical protein